MMDRLRVTYECSEKVFKYLPANLPEDILELNEVWRIYNQGLIKGWSSENEAKSASDAVDRASKNLLPYVKLELNSEWLDDPSIIAPTSSVISLDSDSFGFDVDSKNLLRLWCKVEVELEVMQSFEAAEFDEWAKDNYLVDLFMLAVGAGKFDTEAILENSSVYLSDC